MLANSCMFVSLGGYWVSCFKEVLPFGSQKLKPSILQYTSYTFTHKILLCNCTHDNNFFVVIVGKLYCKRTKCKERNGKEGSRRIKVLGQLSIIKSYLILYFNYQQQLTKSEVRMESFLACKIFATK